MDSVKIVLGYPSLPNTEHLGRPQTQQNRQFQWFNEPTHIYPVIPAYAATILKQAGHEVAWLDGPTKGWSWEQYLNRVLQEAPDIVAWEVKTPVIKRIWPLVDELKKILPHVKVVLMGDHITALPQESLDNCNVDICLTGGDYDFGLKAFADIRKYGASNVQIDGRSALEYMEVNEECSGGILRYPTTGDLKTLPLIDRKLVPWQDYAYHNGNFKHLPGTYTMAGRDCWWRHAGGCTFCSWTNTFKNFRVQSVDRFMEEIEDCAALGIREVFDDTGTFPIGNWLSDCTAALQSLRRADRSVRVPMVGCNMRPGALRADEYRMLKAAGFRFILFGLESANQSTLERINKGQRHGDIERSVRWAAEAGLDPHATCMVGYPWESEADARRTIKLTQRLFKRGWLKTLQATIVIPYPGTQLFEQAKRHGWLKHGEDWDMYGMERPVMHCPMSDETVLKMTRGIYTSCLTPGYMMRKLLTLRTRDDWAYAWRAVKYVAGHLRDFSRNVNSDGE